MLYNYEKTKLTQTPEGDEPSGALLVKFGRSSRGEKRAIDILQHLL